jgi:pimeloyl-ACP methyl ester carboxylesterase
VRKIWQGFKYLVVIALLACLGVAYYLSETLLYFRKPKSEWEISKRPECAEWLDKKAYADLSSPEKAANPTPIDLSCAQALAEPKEDFEVQSSSGLKIHYVVYPTPLKIEDPPLFLHIHGISGNYLHGSRYLKAAERMGFQLVAMELGNHGMSQKTGSGAAYGCREDVDVLAVVDDLRKRFPDRLLYLHSSSMGAMSLANALPLFSSSEASEGIVAMTFENPIPSLRDVVVHSPQTPPVPVALLDFGLLVAGWRAGYNFETCRPIDNLKYASVPILVQFSEKDDLVTLPMVQKFMMNIPATVSSHLEVFKEGSHSAVWNANPALYEKQTLDNFKLGLQQFEDVSP